MLMLVTKNCGVSSSRIVKCYKYMILILSNQVWLLDSSITDTWVLITNTYISTKRFEYPTQEIGTMESNILGTIPDNIEERARFAYWGVFLLRMAMTVNPLPPIYASLYMVQLYAIPPGGNGFIAMDNL